MRRWRRRGHRFGFRNLSRWLPQTHKFLATIAGFVALLMLTAWLESRGENSISGRATVIDGDSLLIDDRNVRLKGIDAPELGQTCGSPSGEWACGRQARQALARLIAGRSVTCHSWRQDRYDRDLSDCEAGAINLNQRMVEIGMAVSFGDFEGEEADARSENRGIWRGPFERPRQWRDLHRGDVLFD